MKHPGRRLEPMLRNGVLLTLATMVICGFVTTFLIVRPFWIDEWRIIHNLKMKPLPQLWGQLDYLQQFPRLYLSGLKLFSEAFDYSYRSLRMPSFLVGTLAILLTWRLMQCLYPEREWLRYLLVLMVVSAPPFTKYYVQVKQYSMDIGLSLLCIWQFLELLRLAEGQMLRPGRYLLLCGSLMLAPFLSYTYPICIAPAFLLVPLMVRKGRGHTGKGSRPALWMPLLICAAGLVLVYVTDVRQLMADKGMKAFWKYNLVTGLDAAGILENFYTVFSQVGSGFVFQHLFGILGLAAFVRACGKAYGDMVHRPCVSARGWLRLYSVALLLVTAILFLAGKLPLGESRLNAFLTAAISTLIIDLLAGIRERFPRSKAVPVLGAVLYLGLAGNIITTLISQFTEEQLPKKRRIYANTGRAIEVAKTQGLPLLVTPGVAYPYEKDPNLPDTGTTVPGDWVLKTHPAYHAADSIPVFGITDQQAAYSLANNLAAAAKGAVFFDGVSIRIIRGR